MNFCYRQYHMYLYVRYKVNLLKIKIHNQVNHLFSKIDIREDIYVYFSIIKKTSYNFSQLVVTGIYECKNIRAILRFSGN